MKKNYLFFLLFAIVFSKNSTAVSVSITGNANSCPNSGETYYANFSGDGGAAGFTKVVWNCGGAGTFQATGTTTYTQYVDISAPQALRNTSAVVNWGNSNGVTSWVSAQYYYVIVFNYTVTGTESVNLGIMGNPSSINSPSSLCINNNRSYSISCPNGLPIGANGYVWSATNATIVGSGSSATLTCLSGNNSPIVVSVKFSSFCGPYYSSTFSKTITRTTTVPVGLVTRTQSPQAFDGSVTFTYYKPADATFLQQSTDGINWINFNPSVVEVAQGTTVYLYVRPANDCGTGASYRWRMVAPICNTCGAITTYVDNGISNIPNSDIEINTNENIISSIEKGNTVEKIEVKVFPNPVFQNLTISISNAKVSHYKITLFDMLGKQIYTNNKILEIGFNQTDIDMRNIENGIYLLYIDNGAQLTKEKIIVNH